MRHFKIVSSFTILAALATSMSAVAAPKLEIRPSADFRFGFAPQNSQLATTYWLCNTGDDTLRINSVRPGCGCTKAPLDKTAVAPGDSARVEIAFDSKSFMGMTTKSTAISTNMERPDTNLLFMADIVRRPDSTWPMTVRPYKLDLSQVGEKVRDKMTFWLHNVSPEPISVQPVVLQKSLFSIVIPTQIKGNDSSKVELQLTTEAVKKDFATSITLEVTGKEVYRYTIPVKRTLRESPTATAVASPGNGK